MKIYRRLSFHFNNTCIINWNFFTFMYFCLFRDMSYHQGHFFSSGSTESWIVDSSFISFSWMNSFGFRCAFDFFQGARSFESEGLLCFRRATDESFAVTLFCPTGTSILIDICSWYMWCCHFCCINKCIKHLIRNTLKMNDYSNFIFTLCASWIKMRQNRYILCQFLPFFWDSLFSPLTTRKLYHWSNNPKPAGRNVTRQGSKHPMVDG